MKLKNMNRRKNHSSDNYMNHFVVIATKLIKKIIMEMKFGQLLFINFLNH